MPVRGQVVAVAVTGLAETNDTFLKGRFRLNNKGYSIYLTLESIGHTLFQTPQEAWDNIHVGDAAMYGAESDPVS